MIAGDQLHDHFRDDVEVVRVEHFNLSVGGLDTSTVERPAGAVEQTADGAGRRVCAECAGGPASTSPPGSP
jgi:hypothetical protein